MLHTWLNASLGLGKKVENLADFASHRLDLAHGRHGRSFSAIGMDALISGTDRKDPSAANASAPTADRVVPFEAAPEHGSKGRYFLPDRLIAAHHCKTTDAVELVQGAATSQERTLPDVAMPAEQRCIGEDDVAFQDAIVPDVCGAHERAVVVNARGPLSAGVCRPVNRGRFTNEHVIANDQPALSALLQGLFKELEMLAIQTNVSARTDVAISADDCWPFDHAMRLDDAASPDTDVRPDDRVRLNLYIVGQLGGRVHNCR